MAESGLLSAIGMAIESVWRRTPTTVISGSNYKIGATASPHRFHTVSAGGGLVGKSQILTPANEITGGVIPRRTMQVSKTYDGSIPFIADGENLYYYLLGIFGRDIQSAVIAGPPGMYPHTFAANVTFPSFTVEEIFGQGVYGRVSNGAFVNKLDLTFGDTVTAQASMMPYRQVPNYYLNGSGVLTPYNFGSTPAVIPAQMSNIADGTKTWQKTTTPNYVDVPQGLDDTGPFTFARMGFGSQGGAFASAFMTVDGSGVDVELLKGFTINIDRHIDGEQIAGSGFDMGTCVGGEVTVSGKFPILYKDTVVQLAHLNHASIGFNFKITGATLSGAAAPYSLEVYIPKCKFTVPDGPMTSDGPIHTGGDFFAYMEPVSGTHCVISLVNTFDNTSLGGACGTSTLGGGGWAGASSYSGGHFFNMNAAGTIYG